MQVGHRESCQWVVETSKGPRPCSFQAAVEVGGHAYCKTHAKAARKAGPKPLKHTVILAPAAQLQQRAHSLAPTSESVDVGKAVLMLAREGASEDVIGYLLDGFASALVLRMQRGAKGVA